MTQSTHCPYSFLKYLVILLSEPLLMLFFYLEFLSAFFLPTYLTKNNSSPFLNACHMLGTVISVLIDENLKLREKITSPRLNKQISDRSRITSWISFQKFPFPLPLFPPSPPQHIHTLCSLLCWLPSFLVLLDESFFSHLSPIWFLNSYLQLIILISYLVPYHIVGIANMHTL